MMHGNMLVISNGGARSSAGAWMPPITTSLIVAAIPRPEWVRQNANGTGAVTADGDPVGYMEDRGSLGIVWRQTTDGDRPLFRTDGIHHWLEGGGTKHLVSLASDLTTVVPISIADDMTVYQSFRRPSAGTLSIGLGGVPITTEIPSFWYDGDNKIYYGLPAAQSTAADTSTGAMQITTRRLSAGPRATLRKNGSQVHDSAAGAGALSGSMRYLLRASGSYHADRWYGSLAYSTGHEDASGDLLALETWTAALSV